MYQALDKNRHIILGHDKINHCASVARFMYEHAAYFGIHPDIAYFTGLNHDIGYLNGRVNHEMNGKELFSFLGVDERIGEAIEYHGHKPSDIPDEKKSPLLDLLWCADMSIDKNGNFVRFDGRLKDIEKRYGKDSVAYGTAKETVEYCKQILEERTVVNWNELGIDFTQLDKKKPYSILQTNANNAKSIYLKEFGMDIFFLEKYQLPVPEIILKVVVDENDKLQGKLTLYSDSQTVQLYNDIYELLEKKDSDGLIKRIGPTVTSDMPHEFYTELQSVCQNMHYGFAGRNINTHASKINEMLNEEYASFLNHTIMYHTNNKDETEIER